MKRRFLLPLVTLLLLDIVAAIACQAQAIRVKVKAEPAAAQLGAQVTVKARVALDTPAAEPLAKARVYFYTDINPRTGAPMGTPKAMVVADSNGVATASFSMPKPVYAPTANALRNMAPTEIPLVAEYPGDGRSILPARDRTDISVLKQDTFMGLRLTKMDAKTASFEVTLNAQHIGPIYSFKCSVSAGAKTFKVQGQDKVYRAVFDLPTPPATSPISLTISFAGSPDYNPVSVTRSFNGRANCFLTVGLYGRPGRKAYGEFWLNTEMGQPTAVGLNGSASPLSGKPVTVTGLGSASYTGYTDSTGWARIGAPMPPGVKAGDTVPCTVHFDGDAQYNPVSANARVLVGDYKYRAAIASNGDIFAKPGTQIRLHFALTGEPDSKGHLEPLPGRTLTVKVSKPINFEDYAEIAHFSLATDAAGSATVPFTIPMDLQPGGNLAYEASWPGDSDLDKALALHAVYLQKFDSQIVTDGLFLSLARKTLEGTIKILHDGPQNAPDSGIILVSGPNCAGLEYAKDVKPGGKVQIPLTEFPTGLKAGDTFKFCEIEYEGKDTYNRAQVLIKVPVR